MALPPLTPEQRAAALEKAAAARRERAAVKNRLKYSSGSLAEVLEDGKVDPVIGKMKVTELLESMPGVGPRAGQGHHGGGRHRRVPPGARARAPTRSRRCCAASSGRDAGRPASRRSRARRPDSGSAHGARRPDGRRQGHHRRLRAHLLPRRVVLRLHDDPRSRGPARSTACTTTSSTTSEFDRLVEAGRVPRVRRRPRRREVRHPARAGRARHPGGTRRPARDRPAGGAPGARHVARRALRLPRATELGGARPPTRRPGHRGRGRARAPARHRARRAGGPVRSSTRSSSTTTFVVRAKNSYH